MLALPEAIALLKISFLRLQKICHPVNSGSAVWYGLPIKSLFVAFQAANKIIRCCILDVADKLTVTWLLIEKKGIRKMVERSQNLQDLFLNSVRKQKISLTIFLINGVKLTGIVTSFDNFCVLLRRDGHSQLVYKHAISTIMPSQPVQMFEGEEA
ncbi:RNA chaperone Hfq [Paenochrobactrum gallinarii]|uniref:RNA-binding protein Hfq n=2 Tax=Paenochrobactrum TaxID=999488 RepID=A0A841LX11_9HYPH|nr:RNA chaperone Hfq [Paenochrobactrum gallinarii]